MKFDWDPKKHRTTIRERGFGFDLAATIFSGETVEEEDFRFDYGERRVRAIGEVDGRVLAVIFTDRDEIRWIISARPASRKERKRWHGR